MAADDDATDDDWPALAAELRAVFDAIDPVPPEVEAVAYGALAWRDVESDLAELVADSADSTEQLAGVRRHGVAPRVVTFEAPGRRDRGRGDRDRPHPLADGPARPHRIGGGGGAHAG
jgi:hypothetical protein